MKGHDLIIVSLHDAKADCSCGGWHYVFTGRLTKGELVEEHEKHLAGLTILPPIQTGLDEKGRKALEKIGQTNLLKGG